jgi:RNA polymerase sigma-70 factor (ECF subfamily)
MNVETEDSYTAFLLLYNTHRRQIFAYIFTMLPNRADAEDVFQRSCLVMWSKFSQYDSTRPFIAWAFGLARFETLNYLRSSNRRLQFDDELINRLAVLREADAVHADRRIDALHRCVESLKNGERDLVEWVYHKERTIREFAEKSSVAPQTVYNRIAQIKRKLESCIQNRMMIEGSR